MRVIVTQADGRTFTYYPRTESELADKLAMIGRAYNPETTTVVVERAS